MAKYKPWHIKLHCSRMKTHFYCLEWSQLFPSLTCGCASYGIISLRTHTHLHTLTVSCIHACKNPQIHTHLSWHKCTHRHTQSWVNDRSLSLTPWLEAWGYEGAVIRRDGKMTCISSLSLCQWLLTSVSFPHITPYWLLQVKRGSGDIMSLCSQRRPNSDKACKSRGNAHISVRMNFIWRQRRHGSLWVRYEAETWTWTDLNHFPIADIRYRRIEMGNCLRLETYRS